MNYIQTQSNDKSIKAIIAATYPSYKKRNVMICTSTSVTLHDLNWSGGTKSEYRACTIIGQAIPPKIDLSHAAPWDNRYDGSRVEIPIDAVIVQGGYFCGKQATLCIYVRPENMARLLSAA